jgi:hypothetical protein
MGPLDAKKKGPMYIYTFLLRMTDTTTSQNIDVSCWDTLYTVLFFKSIHASTLMLKFNWKVKTYSALTDI